MTASITTSVSVAGGNGHAGSGACSEGPVPPRD